MKLAVRDGLTEVTAGLPTFASPGLEARAAGIAAIATDAYEYLAALLDRRPDTQVLVLSEADWPTRSIHPLYGTPNASDGTLVVAGTEAPFWADLVSMVAPSDRAELEAVYGDSAGTLSFTPYFDLLPVHELAHLFDRDAGFEFPRLWLRELFGNLCLHTWVERRSPASLPTLLTLPTLGARAPASSWE